MTVWTPTTFRDQVIQPALLALDLYSKDAERLLLATAMTESNLTAVVQKGGGPALGYFQMEDATHNDIFKNFLAWPEHQHLVEGLNKLSTRVGYADELAKNPQYAAAMARIHYLRNPDPLPFYLNLDAIWSYYKHWWNTEEGSATFTHFMQATKGLMGT